MSLQNPLVVCVERSTKPTRDSGIGHAVVPWTQYHSTCNRNTRPPQQYLRCCLLHHMRPAKGANPPRKPPGQGTHRSRPSIAIIVNSKAVTVGRSRLGPGPPSRKGKRGAGLGSGDHRASGGAVGRRRLATFPFLPPPHTRARNRGDKNRYIV